MRRVRTWAMSGVLLALLSLFIIVPGPVLQGLDTDSRKHITVRAVGDIMMGTIYPVPVLPPDDGKGSFDSVKEELGKGRLLLGNLEGPLSDGCSPDKCKDRESNRCFEFVTPTRYVAHLVEAGFQGLTIANNHTYDCGTGGIESTIATLREAGIQPAGGEVVAEFEIEGRRIAVLGFSYKSTPYSHSILDLEKGKESVRLLKEKGLIVIVSFHGGGEGRSATSVADRDEVFLGERRGNVVRFARGMIDAGADLVIGHGPHVLRALELYKDRLIAYSLGNFFTYGMFNIKGPGGISVILEVRLDRDTGRFTGGRVVSVHLVNGGLPEIDAHGDGVALLRKLSAAGRGRGVTIDENGDLRPAGESSKVHRYR